MGSEARTETWEEAGRGRRRTKSPQKLSLFSLTVPQQSSDPPGMLTPPFRAPASVPFLWEEAPGKPLLGSNPSSAIARCLELPPRLQLMESSNNNTPSPTTVLDGPYVGRSSSFTSSFGRDLPPLIGSFRRGTGNSDDSDGGDGILQVGSLFHSKRRGVRSWSSRGYFGSFGMKASFSSSSKRIQEIGEVGGGGNSSSKVKINRFKSTGSFFSFPRARASHLWVSIYEGFKQVVPWRNKTTKKDGS